MAAADVREAGASRNRSVRMYDDAWDLIGERDRDHSGLIRDMTDAGLGYARCFRCSVLVPAEFGDLTGKPLADWVAEARKAVTAQHRAGHHPIAVGNGHEPGEPVPVKTAARKKPAPRTEAPVLVAAGSAPRCGVPVRPGIGAALSPCARPAGHPGQHMSEASYGRKLEREAERLRNRVPHAEPLRPAPGSAVFLEPGGSPVTTEVPARKRTRRQ